ncbi:uncharacterized protein LOC116842095 isoform X4 [Odontomachus brunneus]|uniref:uncharacterized protein LOC116842095 isoform X4 n=1 Tax=Odontomachus brunneus TaxID=486640 RepID=UPI0013F1FAA0|nr:uncharacterized protein LOC116842095 isoform X4 [Odontomachus brunneus]
MAFLWMRVLYQWMCSLPYRRIRFGPNPVSSKNELNVAGPASMFTEFCEIIVANHAHSDSFPEMLYIFRTSEYVYIRKLL